MGMAWECDYTYTYSCLLLSVVEGHQMQSGGVTSTQPLNNMIQNNIKWLIGPISARMWFWANDTNTKYW